MAWLYRDDRRRASETARASQRPVAAKQRPLATGGIGGGVAWGGMADSSPSPNAGGCFIAAAILLGAIIGVMRHQPTVGVLVGTAIGVAAALIVWLRDRVRRG